MSVGFFDIVVAKEYEIRVEGRMEKRTAWNKVGRAWPSKSGEAISFELFLIPNQRYVVQLRDRNQEFERKPLPDSPPVAEKTFLTEDVKF